MTKLRNELPIAVHVASGGDARVRTGGQILSFDGVSEVTVQLSGATRFRGFLSAQGTSGAGMLIGYQSPVTAANASQYVTDVEHFEDDVPDRTNVYFRLVNPDDLTPVAGSEFDTVNLSFYG